MNKIIDKIFPSKSAKELNRLYKQKRYTSGLSTLFGFPIYFADALTLIHGGDEIFKKQIYLFETKKENPLIIDCGANIGLSVIYFKKLFPESKIIAFEPDKQLFSILKKNVENYNDIKLFDKAVWINDGTIDFQEEGGFSGRIPKIGDTKNIVKVSSLRLKNIINQPIDMLKIDIEGAEYEVIKDCADVLHFVDKIFIEYHSHINEPQKLNELLTILTNAGYRYHIQEAYTRDRPFVDKELMLGMDLQLNIFGYRN